VDSHEQSDHELAAIDAPVDPNLSFSAHQTDLPIDHDQIQHVPKLITDESLPACSESEELVVNNTPTLLDSVPLHAPVDVDDYPLKGTEEYILFCLLPESDNMPSYTPALTSA